MDINLMLLFILCHLLMDFIFQNDNILKLRFPNCRKKSTQILKSVKGNFYHTLVHLLGTFFIVSFYSIYTFYKFYILSHRIYKHVIK